MKIGILHLSDLHLQNDIFQYRIEKIANAINYDTTNLSNLYLVFTGDITSSGKVEEFNCAKLFIETLNLKLKPKDKLLQIKTIMVPGNHDCYFDNERKTRKLVINDCRKDSIEEEDYFKDAMAVQRNYWDFHKEITNYDISDEVSYSLEFRPHLDFKLHFHCYNTSWLSEISEKQGNLIIPENKFIKNDAAEYIVSIFHHPIEWLSSNTKRNNKQRFEEHLINNSNLVLYGHEHDKGSSKAITQKNNKVVFCGGKAFHKNDIKDTGFSFYEIDLSDKSINIKTFCFDGEYYSIEHEDNHKFTEISRRPFTLSDDFENKIKELKIPVKHSKKEKLELSDIFIYPDLEPIIEDESFLQYPNSKEIIEKIKKEEKSKILIHGSDQSGKTTLLYVLFKRFYEMGLTPIYLRGKHCKETNLKSLIKKALKEQYKDENVERFFQLDKKVLFIDNLNKSELNYKYKRRLIELINSNFDYIIITTNNNYSTKNITEESISLKEYNKYKILPLGHEKRSELIEQWLKIGQNTQTIQEDILFADVKHRFSEINTLIGNRLLPSYPIFILTLLQSLDENLQNFSQTSYANIYLLLIRTGLIKEGVKNEDLTSILNILKELAYYLYKKNTNSFNRKEFDEFMNIYTIKYFKSHTLSCDKILQVLSDSNILKNEDNYYNFSYKYIFYFLIAQKLSNDIDTHQDLIYELCNNIHLEINANIIIFLSHHTKAQVLVDNIVFTSQLPFETSTPISLNKNDEFVKFITEFTNEIKDNIIEERNPRVEIKRELKHKDEIERKRNRNNEQKDDQNLPVELIEINQAVRTVKIIGQIVKNQSGDFERDKLVRLVEAAYNTIFRFLGFYSEMLINDKELIIETLVDNIKEKTINNNKTDVDSKTIEDKVRKFLQFISWRICVDSITTLMYSVGTKGQNELFETVNHKIGTTASKIVTFAIKTCYDKIDLKELQDLFEENKDNYFAKVILKEYIRRYLYTNFVSLQKRDRIIEIAGFEKQKIVGKLKSL